MSGANLNGANLTAATVIGPMLLGAGFALGLIAIGRGIAPPTPPLARSSRPWTTTPGHGR